MKKIILLLGMASSSVTLAQITDVSDVAKSIKCESIGKVSPIGVFMGEMKKCPGDVYEFIYRDYKYTKITEIKQFSFADKDGAYEFLYKSIAKGLENPPKDDVVLKLPEDLLSIKFEKALGITTATIYHTNKVGITGMTQSFTKKQLDKLFGKK
ncbi:hypothetical protein [Chryseobacterium oncorhynchi]|uniref:Uncharacterized protein n=1 Tax=Chryseobacterium oncorhynchi TaxID=741074 RepID=A0A316WPQ4_9FLAO|nr:hypothetical protein [Chryseobacterium oncorhynchi]PWN63372.1 hypothetical protein C1638_015015 [Chryseobacterium oncorhynchi]